jgi:D-aspartate ligase
MPAGTVSIQQQFEGLDEILRRKDGHNPARPPAVIASTFQTGLNLLRDLEQRGVRVVGVDFRPENPGFRSIYGRAFLCPNPDTEPDAWVAYMRSLSKAMGERPVLIAAADVFILAIGRHASELSKYFLFSEEGVVLQAKVCSKETQYTIAAQHALPSPGAAFVRTREELEAFARTARFPVLLKPRQQREWMTVLPEGHPFRYQKTVSSQSVDELLANYGKVSAMVPEAVAQEEIVGPDSAKYCYLSVYSKNGQRLGACVIQELRAYPLTYGSATMVQPAVDEEIDRVCDEFLRSVGMKGLCEIELKRDTRDGQLRLIEVNPRFSITGDVSKYMGVETGYLHYLDLIGETPEPQSPSTFDFRHVVMTADFAAFPNYLAEGELGWGEWLESYRGTVKYFDFDPRDRKVAWKTAKKSARALLSGLWQNLRSSRNHR